MPDDLAERRLVVAWQRGLPGPLQTTDGRQISIVYRGRCPGGAGPDIRGALFAFANGQLVEGDVEFHRRASDWFAHGHHHDRHYRSVALHVVLEADAEPPSDPVGRSVPTLVVPPDLVAALLSADAGPGSAATCHRGAKEQPSEKIGQLLDDLGDRRLTQRAARFEAELTRLTPEQLAYEGLFDALGFSRNREPFLRLARAVPIELLAALVGRRAPADALVLAEAILFGAAGLLPSQRPDAQTDWEGDAAIEEWETIWALYQNDWDGVRLGRDDWIFGGVRPANYPTRRIATAARLVVRFRQTGVDGALLGPLRSGSASLADLEGVFSVEDPNGYWATHCDFGRPLPGHPAALLGRDRARDTLVNVTLPLALALAASTSERALADAAWAVYRTFPRPSAYLATEKLAADLGLPDRLVSTARRQQGLLHLLRNHCEQAGCVGCPVNVKRDS